MKFALSFPVLEIQPLTWNKKKRYKLIENCYNLVFNQYAGTHALFTYFFKLTKTHQGNLWSSSLPLMHDTLAVCSVIKSFLQYSVSFKDRPQ